MTKTSPPMTPAETRGRLLHQALLASAHAEVRAYHARPLPQVVCPPAVRGGTTDTGVVLALVAGD